MSDGWREEGCEPGMPRQKVSRARVCEYRQGRNGMVLLNAFSLSMLPIGEHGESWTCGVQVKKLDLEVAVGLAQGGLESAVGHADTAAIIAQQLGARTVPVCRVNVRLRRGQSALVAQYVGPRLPEGVTVLPEGARIDWYLVTVPV